MQMFQLSSAFLTCAALTLLLTEHAGAEEVWSFITLADWHGAEEYARKPGIETNNWENKLGTLKYIKEIYGRDTSLDLMLLPGDSNNGKWDIPEFINKLDPSLTPQEAVLQAGRNCYSTMKSLFSQGGFDTLLMAVGDHELGGNAWIPDSSKVLSLPQYRQGFVEGFNRNEDGDFWFPDKIGSLRSRPVGTLYENTSYIYKHLNAVFITIDAFKQVDDIFMDRENGVGGEGVVTCTVNGKHLEWFEKTLKAVSGDPSVKHIFVQAHLPIMQPVRKVACSGQFLDYGESSEFWKLMETYNVDVYFAGEVHANTATKSENSNLIQIVSRGNSFNNFLKIDVTQDKINILLHNEIGSEPRFNNNYEVSGRLVIDKSLNSTHISSEGELKLLDRDEALIHFDFEGVVSLRSRQVLGMAHPDSKKKLVGDRIKVRGIQCKQSMPNLGVFGQQYDAQAANLVFVDGKKGQHAGYFGSQSRLALYSTGPFAAGGVISLSFWIKTERSFSEMILVHYGATYGQNVYQASKDFFTLTLDNGKPSIRIGVKQKVTADIDIADGNWHHLAVSMPKQSCLLSEFEIYIDGNSITAPAPVEDMHFFANTSGRLSIGSFGYSSAGYDDAFPNFVKYRGMMDDFKLWARPLRASDFPPLEKSFERTDEVQCNKKGLERRVIRGKWNKCQRQCTKDIKCFGFEFRKLPNGKPKCILFQGKPTIGGARENTSCGIVVD